MLSFKKVRLGCVMVILTYDEKGHFRGAWYEANASSAAELIVTGITRPAKRKAGCFPGYTTPLGICVDRWAPEAIDADRRFLAAMKRVLDGEPCPDFRLLPAPKPPRAPWRSWAPDRRRKPAQ